MLEEDEDRSASCIGAQLELSLIGAAVKLFSFLRIITALH